jgi:hypothetical protein
MGRLIALDKCPGVRPICICDPLRRLMGQLMGAKTRRQLQYHYCADDQLCAGLECGAEGAIHAMADPFLPANDNASDAEHGFLTLDASNAFNSVSRVAALWNARILWPSCSRFLFNAYRGEPALHIHHGSSSDTVTTIYSREGVAQGDPLSMLLFVLAILPLTKRLRARYKADLTQVFFADDGAARGPLHSLASWCLDVQHDGPAFGYCLQLAICSLTVPSANSPAVQAFSERCPGVQLTDVGHRHLGGFIGSVAGRRAHVQELVSQHLQGLAILTDIACEGVPTGCPSSLSSLLFSPLAGNTTNA